MIIRKEKLILSFGEDDAVYDLIDLTDTMNITDYSCIHHKFSRNGDDTLRVDAGFQKERKKVRSISSLTNIITDMIQVVLNEYDAIFPATLRVIGINNEQAKMVADQIIMDLLYNKYLAESPVVSHTSYADNLADIMFGRLDESTLQYLLKTDDDPDLKDTSDAFRKRVERSAKNAAKLYEFSELRDELQVLGIDIYKFVDWFAKTNIEKSKVIWDILFWNASELVKKQYNRSMIKANRNYTCRDVISDLTEYNIMVNGLLPSEKDSSKEYFNSSMTYYALESYRRIDFNLKVTHFLLKHGITDVSEIKFLTERFHPRILSIMEGKSGNILYTDKIKYYRPLWNADRMVLGFLSKNGLEEASRIATAWFNCQIVRAKVYELFNHHAMFVSDDYDDLKKFLMSRYDVSQYHRDEEAWAFVLNYPKPPASSKKKDTPTQEARFFRDTFFKINTLLFPPSKKRIIQHAASSEIKLGEKSNKEALSLKESYHHH